MKTLVTGGAGFIGSNIVRLLVEKGHEVTVIDNLLTGYRCNLTPFPEVHFIEGDIRDAKAVRQAVAGAEVIKRKRAIRGRPLYCLRDLRMTAENITDFGNEKVKQQG